MLADIAAKEERRPVSQLGFLAICGLMGSGKTTLARGLARLFDWSYAPAVLPAVLYIPDQFLDTKRWAFETQTAFLIHKALSILNALERGASIVLDRSLSEDVSIFARYFHEHGDIDDRSYTTYQALASHILSTVPNPQLSILCDCPLETIKRRITLRGRDFQKLYPPGHLEQLSLLYENWREVYNLSDLYVLDTNLFDTRDPQLLASIANEVISIARSAKAALDPQIGLFDDFTRESFKPSILRLQNRSGAPASARSMHGPFRVTGIRKLVTSYPSAYIGAPFTAQITPTEPADDMLFDIESPHGLLHPGPFRRLLTNIEAALRGIGISPFLPHREINKWGKREVPSEEVATLCSDYVRECDIFVGVPGMSNGTHYEMGLAIGLGKPTIVIHCEEIPRSYLSNGLATSSDRLLVLRCGSMKRVPSLLASIETKNFLSRHVPLDFSHYDQKAATA